MADNKNVISADHEHVGQGYRLQKSIYLGFHKTDFNKTFTKMPLLGMANKRVTSADLENVEQGYISKRVIFRCYQTELNQMFFMNDDASGIVVLILAGPHFLTLDNCLLYMDAPQKPVIYLLFIALV